MTVIQNIQISRSAQTEKILVIGFSVTEMPSSYFPIAQRTAQTQNLGIELRKCGIGGITTESLPYFIDHVLDRHPDCTRVVFEIATSYVRQVYQQHAAYNNAYHREIWQHVERLILACHERGKEVAFFNLPRADVNYADDMLESIILKVCSVYSTPVLSLSNDFFLQQVDIPSLLVDEVHPTPLGAQLYAEKLLSFLGILGAPQVRRGSQPTRHRYNALDIGHFAEDSKRKFLRHGFEADYALVQEGKPLTVNLGSQQKIEGFSVLCGPRSGMLTMTTDKKRDFFCYDEHCYYERMMTSVQPLGTTGTVTFEIQPDIPQTKLLKGEKDLRSREIGIFFLFTE
ncbi:SGNH/GDSL hydrolase family protein [Variovorax sp. RHLX14]|uniref:SGNH/GDSL hydrolase family protein n=1 Tax=Variovorax sp. RHLX14 TaxID=1259731 RepID=UPI003F46BC1C